MSHKILPAGDLLALVQWKPDRELSVERVLAIAVPTEISNDVDGWSASYFVEENGWTDNDSKSEFAPTVLFTCHPNDIDRLTRHHLSLVGDERDLSGLAPWVKLDEQGIT